jgi:hypothetical protein
MKTKWNRTILYGIISSVALFAFNLTLRAQEKVEIDTQEVGNFFQRNWMWITGGVVLLVLILLFGRGGGKNRRVTTTVVKDDLGNVKTVKTTDIRE